MNKLMQTQLMVKIVVIIIEYETNKYNRVINPLGRLEIYRFIIYKKTITMFHRRAEFQIDNLNQIQFYLNKINNLKNRSAVKHCNCFFINNKSVQL